MEGQGQGHGRGRGGAGEGGGGVQVEGSRTSVVTTTAGVVIVEEAVEEAERQEGARLAKIERQECGDGDSRPCKGVGTGCDDWWPHVRHKSSNVPMLFRLFVRVVTRLSVPRGVGGWVGGRMGGCVDRWGENGWVGGWVGGWAGRGSDSNYTTTGRDETPPARTFSGSRLPAGRT